MTGLNVTAIIVTVAIVAAVLTATFAVYAISYFSKNEKTASVMYAVSKKMSVLFYATMVGGSIYVTLLVVDSICQLL